MPFACHLVFLHCGATSSTTAAEFVKWPCVTPLTPSHHAELEQVSPDIDVEDSDEEKVEVEPLQGHPAEGGQQAVVKREGHVEAKPSRGLCCHPLAGEEVQVEEDEGDGQVDVDLHGDIFSDLSVRQRRIEPW